MSPSFKERLLYCGRIASLHNDLSLTGLHMIGSAFLSLIRFVVGRSADRLLGARLGRNIYCHAPYYKGACPNLTERVLDAYMPYRSCTFCASAKSKFY